MFANFTEGALEYVHTSSRTTHWGRSNYVPRDILFILLLLLIFIAIECKMGRIDNIQLLLNIDRPLYYQKRREWSRRGLEGVNEPLRFLKDWRLYNSGKRMFQLLEVMGINVLGNGLVQGVLGA